MFASNTLVAVVMVVSTVFGSAASDSCSEKQLTAAGMYGPATEAVRLHREPLEDKVTIIDENGHAWCTAPYSLWVSHTETRLNHPEHKTKRSSPDSGKACVNTPCTDGKQCEAEGCVQGCETWYESGDPGATDPGLHTGCI